MVWYAIIGTLSAFGIACILWVVSGWFLLSGSGAVMVCLCQAGPSAEMQIRRYRWLRDLGLIRGPLLVLCQDDEPESRQMLLRCCPEIEFCSPEELTFRLELERRNLG